MALTRIGEPRLAAVDMGECVFCGVGVERGTYYSGYQSESGAIAPGHANCMPPLPDDEIDQDAWAQVAEQ